MVFEIASGREDGLSDKHEVPPLTVLRRPYLGDARDANGLRRTDAGAARLCPYQVLFSRCNAQLDTLTGR